ncbi:MAG: hypothetical protein MUF36_10895 [Bacteroidales bacterium]|jgi:carbon monoxide dehydrogenase subunit G|nr:hypothetical protein [Bacteroidales bacterium]
MSDISVFESRTARITCTAEEFYNFTTDIRNFRRFIPEDKFSEIRIERDSCFFNVSMMGKVDIHIRDKKEFSEVSFAGSAMQVNEFSLDLKFHDIDSRKAEVKITAQAHLNPFLKMLAAEPINRFLETLVSEIEKFYGWKDIRRDS